MPQHDDDCEVIGLESVAGFVRDEVIVGVQHRGSRTIWRRRIDHEAMACLGQIVPVILGVTARLPGCGRRALRAQRGARAGEAERGDSYAHAR